MIEELKKEIQADIEKMIKGTVYIVSSVSMQDNKWADSVGRSIGSGAIYIDFSEAENNLFK